MKLSHMYAYRSLQTLVSTLVLLAASSAAHSAEPSAVEPNTYDAHCALCHQRGGVGVVGQFPRLSGRVGEIAAMPIGRQYLIEVVLFGIAGKIEVDRHPLIGVMPSFAALTDADIATTLNYLISLQVSAKTNTKIPTVTAAEVAKVRGGPQLTATQVLANRAAALAKNKKK